MTASAQQIQSVAKLLLSGGVILSDNDGTMAPFTASPDDTIIPADTIGAIRDIQNHFGNNSFIPVSGRPEQGLRGVFGRSSDQPFSPPFISDDGALFVNGPVREETLSAPEKDFMKNAHALVQTFIDNLPDDQKSRVAVEMKMNGININTNKIHAELDVATADTLDNGIHALFTAACVGTPLNDDKPCFAIHHPSGHGLEIRSQRTTKMHGVLHLIERGIIAQDAPLVFFGDDIKRGGNDVEVSQFVQNRGGIVVQVKHLDALRAYADENRALTPDIVLIEPPSMAKFLTQVMDAVKETRGQTASPNAPAP